MKLLIINGPNINLLGLREPEIYGSGTFVDLQNFIKESAAELGFFAELFQSNSEGAIVDEIQGAYGRFDGIIINPAAYTHTSIAIPDALKAVSIAAVEVHLSDIHAREDYRRVSFTSQACIKTIAGQGFMGYKTAMHVLKDFLHS